jgi:hypothetical protein
VRRDRWQDGAPRITVDSRRRRFRGPGTGRAPFRSFVLVVEHLPDVSLRRRRSIARLGSPEKTARLLAMLCTWILRRAVPSIRLTCIVLLAVAAGVALVHSQAQPPGSATPLADHHLQLPRIMVRHECCRSRRPARVTRSVADVNGRGLLASVGVGYRRSERLKRCHAGCEVGVMIGRARSESVINPRR